MHVWVDREGCISCGQCEETCPQVFAIMEDGLADVTQQPDEELDLDYVQGHGVEMEFDYALSNSLAFGGHNASILIKKYK